MNDRDRAYQVLSQMRDLLSARLVDRVNDVADDLLDDARGDSYGGEIDSLFEQLGNRLNQVNIMLSALPANIDSGSSFRQDASAETLDLLGLHDASHRSDVEHSAGIDTPQSPSGRESAVIEVGVNTPGAFLATSQLETVPSESAKPDPIYADAEHAEAVFAENLVGPVTSILHGNRPSVNRQLEEFCEQVLKQDLRTAGATLSNLLSISHDAGSVCAARFADRMASDPTIFSRLCSLADHTFTGSVNDALMLLWDCFGLQGPESLFALQSLRQTT